MFFFNPRLFKKTSKCARCTKRYKLALGSCPHCIDIKDGIELDNFIAQHESEKRGAVTIGLYFMLAAVLVLLLMALASS